MSKEMGENNFNGLSATQQIFSSCTGGIITALFMTPFDVVKVRLQTQQRLLFNRKCFLYCNGLMDHICNCAALTSGSISQSKPWYNRPMPPHLNGTIDAFVKISRSEGVKSLWSGLSPTLIVAMPNTILYLSTYEYLLKNIKNLYPPNQHPYWAGGIAGGLARMWAVTLFSPLELLRTRMQAKNVSVKDALKVMFTDAKFLGITSLWRGCIPTILRDVPFSILYWGSYENIKRTYNQPHPSFNFALIAGAISGGMAGTITLPLDVVKTYQQVEIDKKISKPSTTRSVLMTIYKQQGPKGLFTGLVPRLAKVMPACGIMLGSYEYAKNYFRNKNYGINT